jgi:NADH-quinone oxidoreductase subunit C
MADTSALSEPLGDMADVIADRLGDILESHAIAHGELTINVAPFEIVNVLRFLRDDPRLQFVCVIDICGVDYPERTRRFDVVYHLLSPRQNARIRVKVETGEDMAIPSATEIYPGADWFEREAYDLYGILFTGHPDLRRLLTDYGFQGHPLRKDFPLTGFLEVRYDNEQRRVIYEPVKLPQEFRSFDFLSPWEGVDYDLPGDEKAS